MKTALTLTVIFILFGASNSLSQNFIIDNSVYQFEAGNYQVAQEQIERAAVHPRFELFPKTWYYYYKINEQLANYDKMTLAVSRMVGMPEDDSFYLKFKSDIVESKKQIWSQIESGASTSSEYLCLIAILEMQEDMIMLESVNLLLANHFLGKEELDSALTYFSKDANQREIRIKNYVGMLRVLDKKGDSTGFNDIVSQAKNEFPNDPEILYFQINQFIERKLYFRAKSVINAEIDINPIDAGLYIKLGEVDELLNLENEAIIAYRKAYGLDGNSLITNFKLGSYYKNKIIAGTADSIKENAQLYLEQAERIAPTDLDVLEALEEFYLEIRDVDNYSRVRNVIRSL